MKTIVECNSRHTGTDIEWTGKKSYRLEEGKERGESRAEEPSAAGDGGEAAISLTPDTEGMHVCIFESSQLEDFHVGNLL